MKSGYLVKLDMAQKLPTSQYLIYLLKNGKLFGYLQILIIIMPANAMLLRSKDNMNYIRNFQIVEWGKNTFLKNTYYFRIIRNPLCVVYALISFYLT